MKNSAKQRIGGAGSASTSIPVDVKLCWNAVPHASEQASAVSEEIRVDNNSSIPRTSSIKHRSQSSLHALDELKELTSHEQLVSGQNPFDQREQALNKVMGVVIVLNALMMGIELDYGPNDPKTPLQDRLFWFISESLFISVFVIELIIRLSWERTKWALSWWNWLDFIVVAVAVIETWVLTVVAEGNGGLQMLTLLRVVRLVRLVRVVKLMRMFRSLYVTVMAFKHALASMINIIILMLAGIFLSAIFTTATIGHNEELRNLQMGIATGKERFGSIPDSMYSLFELMTLEGWEVVGRPLVKAQPAFAIFLFVFIMIFTFGLLNMVVAMVVEKTIEQARSMDEIGRQESKDDFVARLKAVFLESDIDHSGTITADELGVALQENPKARHYLESVGIKTDRAHVLFAALDGDESGEVTLEELVQGCARIRGTGSTEWDILAVQASVRTVQTQMHRLLMLVQEIRDRPAAFATQSDSSSLCQNGSLNFANTTRRHVNPGELDDIVVERLTMVESEILPCAKEDAMTVCGIGMDEVGGYEDLISRLEACVNTCTRKHDDVLATFPAQIERLLRQALEDNAVNALNMETKFQNDLLRRLETETQARTMAFDEWKQQLQNGPARNSSADNDSRIATPVGHAQPSNFQGPRLSLSHITDRNIF